MADSPVPLQSRENISSLIINQGGWYIGLLTTDNELGDDITAQNVASVGGEFSGYVGSRPSAGIYGDGNGNITNASSMPEITLTADCRITAYFVASVATKGSTSGTLLFVKRLSAPVVRASGEKLKLRADVSLLNLS